MGSWVSMRYDKLWRHLYSAAAIGMFLALYNNTKRWGVLSVGVAVAGGYHHARAQKKKREFWQSLQMLPMTIDKVNYHVLQTNKV